MINPSMEARPETKPCSSSSDSSSPPVNPNSHREQQLRPVIDFAGLYPAIPGNLLFYQWMGPGTQGKSTFIRESQGLEEVD